MCSSDLAGVGAALGALGGAGVGAAPVAVAGMLEKTLIKTGVKQAAEQIAKEQGEKAAEKFVAAQAKRIIDTTGGKLGMAAQAAFHGVGETGSRAIEELQAQGKDVSELDFKKLAPAMALHATADYFAEKIGLGSVSGLGAKGESLIKDIVKNVVTTGAKELPPELVQQVAERYGADLSLVSPEALNEYFETAIGSFIQPGGPAALGGVRGHYAQKLYQKEKAALGGKDEGTRIDTGAGEPGVSVPGEERTVTTGPSATDVGGVERTELSTGRTETGEAVQPDTLEEKAAPSALDQKSYDELLEIKNNYQTELNSMLYKNGNAPRVGTKRREE